MVFRLGSGSENRRSAVDGINPALPAIERMDLLVDIALNATDRADRNEAAQALQEFGSAAVFQLELATFRTIGASEKNRGALVEALRIMASSVEEAYPVLTQTALQDPSESLRRAAGFAITSSRSALDTLEEALQHPQELVRVHAVDALGKFHECGVPGLRVAAKDPLFEEVRLRAVKVLGEMTMFSEDPIPVLKESLQDPSERVREAAGWELSKTGHRPMGTPSED